MGSGRPSAFLDKDFLDIAMRLNPEAKMCPGSTIEKENRPQSLCRHVARQCSMATERAVQRRRGL